MIRNEDLMQLLLCYGRGMSQDFVTRSDNINDVIYYLRAECEFEVLKLTSFVTTNLIHFEKRAALSSTSGQAPLDKNSEEVFDIDNPG
ncbi:MAG: hypothetical protein ACLQGU_15665 [bacterium]